MKRPSDRRAATPRWRTEDLADATARAVALAILVCPVVFVVVNDDEPRAPRDGREAA